jgi:glutamate racemase
MSAGTRPIGVFDSGVGGLTVFKALELAFPGESLIYLGDTARVPYGTRSPDTVVRYSLEAARFMHERRIKLLVVACNTASAVALEAVAGAAGAPVVGVIAPGARRAVKHSKNGRIGVIGTRATIGSGAYEKAILAIRPDAHVVSRACPLFVPLAEEGWTTGDVARQVAEHYLDPLREHEIDTLVLGCTHYPLLRGIVAEAVGSAVTIVDSAASVVAEVREHLEEPPETAARPPEHHFYVTDVPAPFQQVAERFLGRRIDRLERVEYGG